MMMPKLFILNELNESGATGAETIFSLNILSAKDLGESGVEIPEREAEENTH